MKHFTCYIIYLSELEVNSSIINWNYEITEDLDSKLYTLWNRTAGDCLLDSVMQVTWGIMDENSVLRCALRDSLRSEDRQVQILQLKLLWYRTVYTVLLQYF